MTRARGAAVALAGAALCAAACGPGRVVRGGDVNQDVLAAVRRGLVATRGLAFVADVPAEVMDRSEIRTVLADDLLRTYPDADVAIVEAVTRRLGLLPVGVGLRAAFEELYSEEGGGFYDPRTKRLVLARHALGAGGRSAALVAALTGHDLVGEVLVAHELTHALQDQHWPLPTAPEPLLDSHGDRMLARSALLEGDATLAGFAYVVGGRLDGATIARLVDQLHDVPAALAEEHPDTPDLVRSTMAFQYDAGTAFAARALAAGGWTAVNRLELDPPTSTEQVLHPERYFERRDAPVEVTLGGTGGLEAAGWRRVFEDTIGELQIRILARRLLPPIRATRAAEGWGGDRLRAYVRDRDLIAVWMTTWDTLGDAAEFAAAMREVLPAATVEERDTRVLVLLAPEAGWGGLDVGRLARRVWSASTASVPSTAPPPPAARVPA